MRGAITGAIALCAIAAPLSAQLHVETGGGEARLDQLPSSSLTAFGGGLDAQLGQAHLQFSGTADDHVGLGVAGTLSGGLHYRFTPAGWRIEVGPVGESARGIGEQWNSVLGGDLNAERDVGPFTLHGGWQQGVASAGSQQAAWRRPTLGADLRLGQLQVGASWQATFVQDSVLRDNVFFSPADTRSDTLFRAEVRDIQDFGVKAAWSGGVLSLDGRVGRRWGANILPQMWWETHAALRLTPIMALTLRTGHLASDALLSLRGGQFTTFGLRLDLLPGPIRRERTAAMHEVAEIVRETATTVHLFFAMPPGTRQMALVSDLTDWRPVNLSRTDDGRWEVVLAAKAGVYRVNISTDNGPWRVPPGLPAADDGFGTKVGLLVLER
jgi:hypothetical protein